jgi:Family of unknown function (DUF6011)
MTNPELIEVVRSRLADMSPSDASWGSAILATIARTGNCSDKQRACLQRLAVPKSAPAARVTTAIGNLDGINALFNRAKSRLKAPSIVIGVGNLELSLDVAGAKARVPGSINVATPGKYGQNTWFGRILQGGVFEASPRVETPAGLIEGLARFAAEPAKVAGEHGKLTGRCCFCNLRLTDERSTAVGYGATCASNWGLPYPTASEARAATAETFSISYGSTKVGEFQIEEAA